MGRGAEARGGRVALLAAAGVAYAAIVLSGGHVDDRGLVAGLGVDGVQAEPGAGGPLTLAAGTTLKWIASDFKGNTSAVRSQTFIPHVNADGTVTGNVPATLSLVLGGPATFGAFTPGVTRTYLTPLGAT